MNKEVSNKKYLMIFIFILLFAFSMLLYNSRFNNKKEEEVIEKNKVELLNDYSRFFTINSCIYRYITYLQSKNIDSVVKVLDEEFKANNNINNDNVFDKVENLNGNYSFVSKKIYYEELDEYNFKYYVYGYIVEDIMDDYGKKFDRYYIVNFDTNKNVFSITPYNETDFKEVTNG